MSENFHDTVRRVTNSVRHSMSRGRPFDELVDESDCVFVKTADGRILFANVAYSDVFTTDTLAVGRVAISYLQDTVAKVAASSDHMILSGCTRLQFDHIGHNALGQPMLFRSAKESLLGLGHPTIAILGVTRIQQRLGDETVKFPTLAEGWRRFGDLEVRDKEIAILLAQGETAAGIAETLDVAKKTVENHRKKILDQLSVDTQIDLVKLLVRIQDNGYGDFGL
jgi:DNA-binding CsgD family transcriptional regulator